MKEFLDNIKKLSYDLLWLKEYVHERLDNSNERLPNLLHDTIKRRKSKIFNILL